MFTLKEIQSIEHVAVEHIQAVGSRTIKRVTTDSRNVKPGDLFIALRGERFDGHEFVEDAFERGALCAIVEEHAEQKATQYPKIIVRDTTRALGELARLHRRKFSLPVIAVTGSSGKTTTKEMMYLILKSKYNVLCTQGNLNNHIGVPQTLFGLSKKHDLAVIEMGMNHAGEITHLCELAEPTHGVITNVGKAHLEFFSSIKRIAEAKGELFDWLGKRDDRRGFVNLDNELVVSQAKKLKKKTTYSEKTGKANVYGELEQVTKQGFPQFVLSADSWKKSVDIQLNVAGVHNVSNALAASAVGKEFGITPEKIKSGLEQFKPVHGRMEVVTVAGVTIVNDAYNANPESVHSALRTIASMDCTGRRIAVLGDMLELGTGAIGEHRKIGAALSKLRCDVLLTFGPLAKCIDEASTVNEKIHFSNREELTEYLKTMLLPDDIVLIKGSHGMNMSAIADSLIAELSPKKKANGAKR